MVACVTIAGYRSRHSSVSKESLLWFRLYRVNGVRSREFGGAGIGFFTGQDYLAAWSFHNSL